jgi:uncharacterized OB-fold protein
VTEHPGIEYGDALTAPFWEAALEGRLVLQRCASCGRYQFYPRPFCISCEGDELEWVDAAGTGTVYSVTTVRMNVLPGVEPPYDVALVEFDEGPRFLGRAKTAGMSIGERVTTEWATDGEKPILMFERLERSAD